MKIRSGFVSNSSSSSFMIYGGEINFDESNVDVWVNKILEGKSEEEVKEIKGYLYEDEDETYPDTSELREYMYDLTPKGFSLEYSGYDHDQVYIGKDPSFQPDDQTHGEWKKEIRDVLKENFGDAISNFGWHEDCSYDG